MKVSTMNDKREQSKPTEPIWRPYLYRQTVTFVVGDPGIGKTTLAYAFAQAVGSGLPFVGLPAQVVPTILMLDYESSNGLLSKKAVQMGEFPEIVLVCNDEDMPPLAEIVKAGDLDAQYRETPFDILIIDNLGTAFSLHDENENAEAEKYVKLLRTLSRKYNCAVWLYHHPSKSLEASGTRKGSGAYAWSRYCGIHVNLNVADKDSGIIEIETAKNREDEDYSSRYIQKIGECEFIECDPPKGCLPPPQFARGTYPIHQAMRSILHMSGVFSAQDAIKAVEQEYDIGYRTTNRALERLLQRNLIAHSTKFGTYFVV